MKKKRLSSSLSIPFQYELHSSATVFFHVKEKTNIKFKKFFTFYFDTILASLVDILMIGDVLWMENILKHFNDHSRKKAIKKFLQSWKKIFNLIFVTEFG